MEPAAAWAFEREIFRDFHGLLQGYELLRASRCLIDIRSPLAREVAPEVNDIVDDLRAIPSGWFGVGAKRDVPENACYVAQEGKVYVWVTPEHRADFGKFTMTILDIATAVQEPRDPGGPGGRCQLLARFQCPAVTRRCCTRIR